MKKISILSLCLLSAVAVSAQKTVLKDAERAMKSGKPFTEVVQIITPAFSDAETKNNVDIYYIPGKAGYKQYDDLFAKKQLGMLKDGEEAAMANALLGGYEYMLKALPLDSLPNEKGKVSPKRSKDIVSTVAGHYSDYNMAAVSFYNVKDYDKAYQMWDVFFDVAENPVFAKSVKVVPDTVLCDVYFNQGIAAWQGEKLENAVKSFRNAIKHGFDKKNVYEYGLAVASGAKDNEALLEFATAGNARYGAEDPQFLNQIINYYLQTEKYDEAINFLNKGIAENPNNAQYYALAGIIYDNQDKRDQAMEMYEKALKLDPENGLANFYKGRGLAAKAGKMQDEYNGNDYEAYKTSTLNPIYRDAITYLEKAYNVDKGNHKQILQVLEIVYYNLNDEAGMKSVEERKLED